ncbi:histidinol-phosphatase HisJ [Sebaldella sp. S0638]|uniref:histidinol-phosphatase HisJ n=1 Tax=Sebaldella sp. S0638 TaxID=2957809 RepID=UPI00209FC17C|nr:histidinol-phosphatase HisJ [Sebaldella sp. S0638]MCP1224980.1 histidinol-phosphatase HisJ [Sebaldella sp. S0638]
MKFLSNLHTHTLYCDGNNEAEDYIKKAIELGFVSIGFSGHSYIAGNLGEGWCMSEEGTLEYIKELKNLKEKYKDKIEVYIGLETDYYSGYKKDIKGKLSLDYTLGSVHLIKNETNGKYYSIDSSPEITEEGIKAFGGVNNYIKKYYDTLLKMIVEQEPDIIGHIDLVKKFNSGNRYFDETEDWYVNLINETLDKIKNTNSIIEINTGAMSRGWTDFPYPSKFILELILKKDIPITLNSDVHSVENIDYYFDESMEVVKETGFKKMKILKGSKFQDIEVK